MENLTPNGGPSFTGYGAKFANWTPTVVTGTALVHTYSATSGPDSTPGLSLSCTGTSATVKLVSGTLDVPADSGFLVLGVIVAASSTSPTLVPFSVAFSDAAGNAVVTATPIASAAPGSTSAIAYNAVVACPVGAATAIVTMAALTWSSTGGYSEVISSPQVMVA
jgi:hypothetical protein